MAKASGSIDLKAYNSASQEATNYISYDSQTGLTVGQEDLDSKVVISGNGIELYDETGNVGTQISSGEVIVGTDETNQITLNEDGIVLSSVEDVETFKAGVGETAVAITYTEPLRDGVALSRIPNSGSEIQVGKYQLGIFVVLFYFTQGVAETKDSIFGEITYDGERTFTSLSTSLLEEHYVKYIVTAHPPYLTFGTRDIAAGDIGIFSATFGRDLIASKEQVVFGKFNVEDISGNYSVIVGNGSSSAKSNALALDNNGSLYLEGDAYVGCYANSAAGQKVTSQAQGQVITVSGVTAQSYKDYAVTFPTPYASTPLVVAGLAGTLTAYGMGMVSVAVNNVSATGFTARVYNASSNDRNITFRYIAIAP